MVKGLEAVVRFTVDVDDGTPITFECDDTIVARLVNEPILRGRTYPNLGFVGEVRTVFDVGANCGAASVHFARHHPEAVVHAFEPGKAALGYLERNVVSHPNVAVHPFGLHEEDREAVLWVGGSDLVTASINPRHDTDEGEPVALRAGGAWADEHSIDVIDLLKVDVEGCEVMVLRSLAARLPRVKVIYVEFDSRRARHEIEALLAPSHDLYIASILLDQGECTYVRKDLAELEAATDFLRQALADTFAR